MNWRAISILELVQRAEGDRTGYLRRDTFMPGRKAIYREEGGLWGKEQEGAEGDICVGGDGATGDSEVTNRDGSGAEENVDIRLGGNGEGGREGKRILAGLLCSKYRCTFVRSTWRLIFP